MDGFGIVNPGGGASGSVAKLNKASPMVDAAGRLRVSVPRKLFDSKLLHGKVPRFWTEKLTGTGSSTHLPNEAAVRLRVESGTTDKVTRQTRSCWNYSSGNGQLVEQTGVPGVPTTGITVRVGPHDDNNGIFLQVTSAGYAFVVRSYVTGAAVDTVIPQSSWNVDRLNGSGDPTLNPSGITLDGSKGQIVLFDYLWLGLDGGRLAFKINGIIHVVHDMRYSNETDKVYMTTPNLPLRYEIENDGSGGQADLYQICGAVMSEGDGDFTGEYGYDDMDLADATNMAATDTFYAIIGIRLKAAQVDAFVKPTKVTMTEQTNPATKFRWALLMNPTVTGTFNYADVTDYAVQIAKAPAGATAPTVSGGYKIAGGYGSDKIEVDRDILSTVALGADVDGTPDTFVLCAEADTIGTMCGGINWKEFL